MDPSQLQQKLSIVPLLPLLGAILNGAFGKRWGNDRAGFFASAAMLGAFAMSVFVFVGLFTNPSLTELHQSVYTWFHAGQLDVTLGLTADHLSVVMMLIITGVGFLIHLYSTGYMASDENTWRFFTYLNLFCAAMLLLVMGDNLVTLFVGWEGVGLCSYLLIGFWFTDEAKASAGKKAFIVNRIGDFGFLVGMFTLYSLFGTLNISELKSHVHRVEQGEGFQRLDHAITRTTTGAFVVRETHPPPGSTEAPQVPYTYHYIVGLALLCLFIGATGKSAQIPLYVWLPDAMAGPTPVSALIHAATMVTAGVYMMGRLSFLYVDVPEVLAIAGVVGVATSLFAALMAFAQNDIKKVLAYSTVSQLGYMFVGVGSGAFFAGSFHLLTHAFFKACLFLGAGAVIHGLHDEQDIRNMGGLKKYMPHTRWTFLIATITISGLLPFSGFFSKDEILVQAKTSEVFAYVAPWLGFAVYLVGSITALCTSFYMFRLYFLTFEGEYRGDKHPHESPPEITVPLWILAILSIAALGLGLPKMNFFEEWTHSAFASLPEHAGEEGVPWLAYLIALGIAWAGFLMARGWYGKGLESPDADPLRIKLPLFYRLSENKFYVDEIYDFFIVKPLWAFSRFAYDFFDAYLIDRVLVNGAGWFTGLIARMASPFENGDLSRYAALTALAVAGLIVWAVV